MRIAMDLLCGLLASTSLMAGAKPGDRPADPGHQRDLLLQVAYVDSKEDRQVFVRASCTLRRRMPGLSITRDPHGSIGEPYGTNNMLPIMALPHRNGAIAYIRAGCDEKDLDDLLAELNTLMAEPALTPATASSARPAPL